MNQHAAEQDSPRYRAHPPISTSDCQLVDDAIDAYSLGVAEPSQRVAIERHLIRCTRCSALIASYQETIAVLALAVPLASPPVSARTALLSRIAVTPQTIGTPTSVFSGSVETFRTPSLPVSSAVELHPTTPTTSQSAWWKVYAAPLATLPLLLALGLMGAWGFNNYAQLHDANGKIAQQSAMIDQQKAQLAFDDQEAVRLAFSPSAKRYNLTSDLTSANGSAVGTFIADPMTGKAMLQVDGLAPGWYSVLVQTQNGSMEQKAVFIVGEEGIATTSVDLDEQVSDFRSVHIRSNNDITETDVAVDATQLDVMMAVIGPDINEDSDTSQPGS